MPRRPMLVVLAAASRPAARCRPHRAGGRHSRRRAHRRSQDGETLTPIQHHGAWWIAGRPGARYGVTLLSRSAQRLLSVVSIDGVNAISGDTAAWNQTGYVLDPWGQNRIDGWQKNMNQVAAFEFTALPDSYAARTGRPANVGVIGVATFSEKVRVVPIVRVPATPIAPGEARREAAPADALPSSAPKSAAPDEDSAAERSSRRTAARPLRAVARGIGNRPRADRGIADPVRDLPAGPDGAERGRDDPLRPPREPDRDGHRAADPGDRAGALRQPFPNDGRFVARSAAAVSGACGPFAGRRSTRRDARRMFAG